MQDLQRQARGQQCVIERGEIHIESGRLDDVFFAMMLPDTVKAA